MLGTRQSLIFHLILLWLKRITIVPILSLQKIKSLSEKTSYELDCIQHLFKCHEDLWNWSYFNSLISFKESSDAFILLEKYYQNKKAWKFDSLFRSKSTYLYCLYGSKDFNT